MCTDSSVAFCKLAGIWQEHRGLCQTLKACGKPHRLTSMRKQWKGQAYSFRLGYSIKIEHGLGAELLLGWVPMVSMGIP